MTRYVVLAYDQMDYERWVHDSKSDPLETVYVRDARFMEGRRYPDAHVVQTFGFRNRRDALDILRQVNHLAAFGFLKDA